MAQGFAHPVLDAAGLPGGPGGPGRPSDPVSRPVAVQLLDQAWVLWRDAAGQAVAAPDRCPHRGAALSLGRVCGGELQCAYHGWRFDGTGRCTAVPALPQFQPPPGHGLAVRPLTEAHGLLWLQPDGAAPRLPVFEAEADARLRKLNVGPFDVATSAPRLVENFLDAAHFAFVHDGWLGEPAQPAVPDHEVRVDDQGLHLRGLRVWQPRSNLRSEGGSWVGYDYQVSSPYCALLRKQPDAQQGWRESIALFVQPMAPELSRAWFRLAVPLHETDDAALQAFQCAIFEQDRPVLESQRPRRLPLDAGAERHCTADRGSMAYRRWLQALGVEFGTC